ncbi:MAG: DUF2156 domain-containing protein [Clostridia bacterium]|nr:DUF2156 domain-containing protein [Clostridia bacterium]
MIDQKAEKLQFEPVSLSDSAWYPSLLWESGARGCEYSFVNLFLWGDQRVTRMSGHAVLFSRFGERYIYPYPIGKGDKREILESIFEDASARDITWRLSGLLPHEKEELERLFPNRFDFVANEGSFDYVYDINDLADLPGRRYHGKRNHCKQFETAYPRAEVVPITEKNLDAARRMSHAWYALREDGETDFEMEKRAIARAFDHYTELGLEGLMLVSDGEVLALTMGNRMTKEVFDVNFEKAMPHATGAYAAINRAFARYIREKYPKVRFLDREEDMGLEGLRRAKMSYHPHHRVEKYRATVKVDK